MDGQRIVADPSPTDRSVDKRAALIAAAAERFTADGFAATRIDDIARDAGVGKGTVYEYFADKDDLLIAACLAQCARKRAALAATLPPGGGQPLATLRALIVAALRLLPPLAREHGRLFWDALTLAKRRPELLARLRDGIADGYGRWERLIAELAADAVRRGEARTTAGDALPLLLTALLDGVTWQRSLRGDAADPPDAEALADLVLALLRADAPAGAA